MIFIGQSKRGFASEAGKSTLTSYRGVPGQVLFAPRMRLLISAFPGNR
jgi:hypothetical protein